MATFTTNEEDQKKAAALQQRLADAETASSSAATAATAVATTTTENKSEQHDSQPVPQVDIAEGVHKYVLLSACLPTGGEQGVDGGGGGNNRSVRHQHRQHFVVSKKNAAYHKDAAEPYVELLERNQYTNIRIEGGGRLALDSTKKTIYIYGYSYGFGLADHALSKSIIEQQHKQQHQQPYTPYDITWSNEGY